MARERKPRVRNLDPEYLKTKEYLDTTETAAYGPLSESTLAKKRMDGTGPAYIRVSPRKIVYKREVYDAWLEAQTRSSTYEGA